MMYDLIRMNTTTLCNKELAKSITTINEAVKLGNKSSWVVAEELARISREELYEEDFDTDKAFAEFVGITKGYLSQCKRAVDFKENHPDVDTTVGKAYLFSTVDLFEDFQNWVLETYTAQPCEFSDKAVRDLIKEYNSKDDVEDVEEVEEEVENDESSETDNADIEEAMNVMIEVYDNDGNKYVVPLSVLNQYKEVEG